MKSFERIIVVEIVYVSYLLSFSDCSGTEPSVAMIDMRHFDRLDHDDVVKKW